MLSFTLTSSFAPVSKQAPESCCYAVTKDRVQARNMLDAGSVLGPRGPHSAQTSLPSTRLSTGAIGHHPAHLFSPEMRQVGMHCPI